MWGLTSMGWLISIFLTQKKLNNKHKYMQFKIEKNISMPEGRGGESGFFESFPFDEMVIGDAVKVSETNDNKQRINMQAKMKHWLKRRNKDYKAFNIRPVDNSLYVFKVK